MCDTVKTFAKQPANGTPAQPQPSLHSPVESWHWIFHHPTPTPSHPESDLANFSLGKQLRLTPREAHGPLKLEWVGK